MVVAMKKKSSMPDSNNGSHQGTFIMKGIGLQTFQCYANDKFFEKKRSGFSNGLGSPDSLLAGYIVVCFILKFWD
jgi:hypothetical protein